MDTKNVLIGLVILGMAFACIAGVFSMMQPKITYGEEIGMVQPNGWNASRDSQYAQGVNLPNSEANVNNGQMHVYNAQATAIVNESYKATNDTDYKTGTFTGSIVGCFLGIGLVVLFAILISKAQPVAF